MFALSFLGKRYFGVEKEDFMNKIKFRAVVFIFLIITAITINHQSILAFQRASVYTETLSPMSPIFEKNIGDYYNYAPCLIQTDSNTQYLYYCGNQHSSEIVDYICWRKGILEDGKWSWSNENVAFGPSLSDWDKCHVCDPDIVQGIFNYNNHTYSWAMTYLGVAQWDCNANQIGIAFSDSIEGPWIKYENNPIIKAPNLKTWGVGQDSMVSLNNKGLIRIIYRYSDGIDDYCKYKDFDFTNVNEFYEGTVHSVTRNGLTDDISHTCGSHVAFDPDRQIYYMAAEHIWDEAKRSCRETMIATLSKNDFENSTGKWNIIYKYNQGSTGYSSNHNSAIARDSYGYIVDKNKLTIAISSSDDSGLWSFKINTAELSLVSKNNSVLLENGHAYKIINKANGLVLDNWNKENGNTCYQYTWTGVYNQQWVATSLGGNNYKLLNRWSKKALDNYPNNTPKIVYIWDDVFTLDQHWEITKVQDNYCKIKNIKTGKVLTSNSNYTGAPVEATTYIGNDTQLWLLTDLGLAESPSPTIISGHKYKIVNCATEDTLDNWNTNNGDPCYSYAWTASNSQQWNITQSNGNLYKVINCKTNKALDSYNIENGAKVYTWDYVANSDQLWAFIPCGNNYFYIINQKSKLALTQSIQGNGNSIFCWKYLGNLTQKWKLILLD